MSNIKLIALDLDGTLLRSDKSLSERTLNALSKASEKGIVIVPSTGRFFDGMPEYIRNLPFVRYAITINGAGVYDRKDNTEIYRSLIEPEMAVELMKELDKYPVLYDCYMNNWGWMDKRLHDHIEEYTTDIHYIKMLRELRSPVEDIKKMILEDGKGIQKTQYVTTDHKLKDDILKDIEVKFPELLYTSSVKDNIEINHKKANKGDALKALCDYLNIDIEDTIAFGDGTNDISMIKMAGIGVAMANGANEVKEIANEITLTNDEDGVAVLIEKYCL